MRNTTGNNGGLLRGSIILALYTTSLAVYSADQAPGNANATGAISSWWNQPKGVTAGWFGLAEPLGSYGLKITGESKEVFYGQISGGLPNQSKTNWINEEKLKFVYDFQPVFGIKGLTFESNWRYRGGGNPQWAAGTPSNFNPATYTSGMGVRILTQQFE